MAATTSAFTPSSAVATSSTTTLVVNSYLLIFKFNQVAASVDFSTATTVTAKPFNAASVAIAIDIAPLPAPKSTTPLISGSPSTVVADDCRKPITRSTKISVSGRGMNTPAPTDSSKYRNGALPVMYCTGFPSNRCSTKS